MIKINLFINCKIKKEVWQAKAPSEISVELPDESYEGDEQYFDETTGLLLKEGKYCKWITFEEWNSSEGEWLRMMGECGYNLEMAKSTFEGKGFNYCPKCGMKIST